MTQRLPVVLMWHMHQPQYRDALSGEYVLPWTYLHALKDYSDMAAHLEQNEAARAVVNFTPVLIEQLQEYAQRVANHLRTGAPLRRWFASRCEYSCSCSSSTGVKFTTARAAGFCSRCAAMSE